MFRIIKIEGESMSPDYNNGDFVIVTRLPLLLNTVKINSVLVFTTQNYGILIKKISDIDRVKKKYFFKGSNKNSVTTEMIGAIDKKDIIGVVLLHFKK